MDSDEPQNAQERADTLSAEQAGILLKANYRNLVKKLQAGRTLSAGERNLLEAVQAGGEPEAKAFARTQSELAKVLGVSRWTIQRAMKVEGHPETRPDGRLDIRAWRAFLQAAGTIEDEDATGLRAENLRLQNRHLELRIAVLNRDYRPVTDIERWGSELGAAIRKLVTRVHRAAPSLEGQPIAIIEARLREEKDDILKQSHTLDEQIRTWHQVD